MDICMDLCDFKFDVLLAVREKQRGVIIVLSVKCIKPAHFTAWHVSIYMHTIKLMSNVACEGIERAFLV